MRDRRLLTLNEELIKQKARLLRERVSRSLSALGPPGGSRTGGGGERAWFVEVGPSTASVKPSVTYVVK